MAAFFVSMYRPSGRLSAFLFLASGLGSSSYFALLLVGFVSSFHCIGMCGGIMGALGLSTPEAIRQNRLKFFAYTLAYNLGRVASYSIAGGLIWLVETLAPEPAQFTYGHTALRILGAAVMLGTGLYLAGWFPDFKRLELIGKPLWRRLEPIARKLLPVKSLPMAVAYGAIWGWLPCGLVYMALLYSVSQASVANPIVLMALFGVGTLPVMLATGLMIHPITRLARSQRFRQLAGLVICFMALISVVFVPEDHSQHMELERAGDNKNIMIHHDHEYDR